MPRPLETTSSVSEPSVLETVLNFASTITHYRRFVSPFVLVCTLAAIIISLLAPKWYKSTASVFPAEKANLFSGLEGVSSLVQSFSPGKALSSLTGQTETDRYIAILNSGAVLGAVINKFDLVHVYEITSYPIERTTKELLSNVEFTVESEGDLTISVYDKDPQRAADMANYFVEMLNRVNTELQVQNAKGNRVFVEERYKRNLDDLAKAEDSLRAFQQRYGIVALPEQTEASIKAYAEIAGRLALKEIAEGVLRRTQGADNPAVAAARVEINEYQRKLEELNSGDQLRAGEMNVFIPFSKVPRLGMEYLRRYRDVEIQYKILQFLTPLYEQAKVEERRQTPSVVVLDRAMPAERKSKPKVSLYALLAFVVSSVIAVTIVFLLEALNKMRARDPERYALIVKAIRSDWFGLRFRRDPR
jgi:tyrosine-protein kinase Etk/Wzc